MVGHELRLLDAGSHDLSDAQRRLRRILDRCVRATSPSCRGWLAPSAAPTTPGSALGENLLKVRQDASFMLADGPRAQPVVGVLRGVLDGPQDVLRGR